VATGVEVSAVGEGEFEALLPLIAAYQGFYEVDEIDNERNRAFFRRFLAPSEDGRLLAARDEAGAILGYACLYWHFSSLAAQETVLMNDLFVTPEARGRGVGRTLIEASADIARERGAAWLEWATAPDNHTAQRLYDSMTSEKSTWLEYELDL
jgi:GNAT superfamily N-acetyltransferase